MSNEDKTTFKVILAGWACVAIGSIGIVRLAIHWLYS
jgi:hypothetical protein